MGCPFVRATGTVVLCLSPRVQPAERELEVRVVFSGGVGGKDAAVNPTRPISAQRGRRVTPIATSDPHTPTTHLPDEPGIDLMKLYELHEQVNDLDVTTEYFAFGTLRDPDVLKLITGKAPKIW